MSLIKDPSRTYQLYYVLSTPFAYGGRARCYYETSERVIDKDPQSGFIAGHGFKPPKPYSVLLTKFTPGTATSKLDGYSPFVSGKYLVGNGFPPATSSHNANVVQSRATALNNALMALQGKLDNSIMNLGENVAEIGQTYSMFQRIVTSSVNFTMCLRDRDIHGAFRELQKYGFSTTATHVQVPKKYISKAQAKANGMRDSGRRKSQYYEKPIRRSKDNTAEGLLLEYNFGFAPLLNDLDNVLTRFAYRGVDGFWKLKPEAVVHRKKAKGVGSSTGYVQQSDDYFSAKMYYSATTSCEVRVWYYIKNMQIMKNRQLGLGNALDLLWNLAPSSWLVDYFANVGNLIGNLHMWSGLQYIVGSATYKTEVVSSRSGSTLTSLLYGMGGWNIHQYKSTGLVREILSSPPTVSAQLNGVDALTLTQKANSLAFSIQKLRKYL